MAAALSPDEKRLHRAQGRLIALMHLATAILAIAGFFVGRSLMRQLHVFVAPVVALIALPFSRIYAREIKALTRRTVDDNLTWRARQLAIHFGARVHAVRIDDSPRGKTSLFVERENADVVISRKMRDSWTAAEVDFAVARTAALPKTISVKTRLSVLLLIGIAGVIIGCVIMMLTGSIYGIAAAPLLALCYGVLIIPRSKRTEAESIRAALDADAAAVEATKDPAAALSAIEKQAASVLSPNALATVLSVEPSKSLDAWDPGSGWRERILQMRQLVEQKRPMTRLTI